MDSPTNFDHNQRMAGGDVAPPRSKGDEADDEHENGDESAEQESPAAAAPAAAAVAAPDVEQAPQPEEPFHDNASSAGGRGDGETIDAPDTQPAVSQILSFLLPCWSQMSCSSFFNLSFPRIQFILLQEGSVAVCERDPKVQRLYWNSTLQGNVARLPCHQENDNVTVDDVDPAAWLGEDVDSQKAIWSQLHPSPEEPSDHHHDSHSESEEGDETADGDKKPAAKPSESQGDNTSSSSSGSTSNPERNAAAAPAAANNNSSNVAGRPRPQENEEGSDNYVDSLEGLASQLIESLMEIQIDCKEKSMSPLSCPGCNIRSCESSSSDESSSSNESSSSDEPSSSDESSCQRRPVSPDYSESIAISDTAGSDDPEDQDWTPPRGMAMPPPRTTNSNALPRSATYTGKYYAAGGNSNRSPDEENQKSTGSNGDSNGDGSSNSSDGENHSSSNNSSDQKLVARKLMMDDDYEDNSVNSSDSEDSDDLFGPRAFPKKTDDQNGGGHDDKEEEEEEEEGDDDDEG